MLSPDSPGLAPPPGVEPYFYSPYSLKGYTNVVIAQCTILTTIVVAARVYTKRFVVKSIILEDCKHPIQGVLWHTSKLN